MTEIKDRTVLVVLGMHRSGTSATSGVFARLGFAPPKHLMTAAPMNAAGFYESRDISAFNDRILAKLGMDWFDVGSMPRNWTDQLDNAWLEEAAALLDAEFETAEGAVLKDPRMCRLLPFWMKVFEHVKRKPLFACIYRTPAEVSGSLEMWWQFLPEYSQLLWMRHNLEAELHSRGLRRAFLSYSELLSDWRTTTARVADELGVTLDMSEKAQTDVDAFLSPSLKHIKTPDAPEEMIIEPTRDVFALLEQCRTSGEDAAVHSKFDKLLQEVEVADGTLEPIAKSALAEFKRATQTRTALEAEEAERTRLSEALNHTNAELGDTQAENARLSEALNHTNAELSNTQAENTRLSEALRMAQEDTEHQRQERVGVARELAKARSKPLLLLRDLWRYQIFRRLAGQRSPLPNSLKARLRSRADGADPSRSMTALGDMN